MSVTSEKERNVWLGEVTIFPGHLTLCCYPTQCHGHAAGEEKDGTNKTVLCVFIQSYSYFNVWI